MTTLLDSTLRREAQLLRFGTYLRKEYINPTSLELAREIPKLLVDYEDFNKLEQRRLVKEVRALITAKYNAMFDSITDELHELAADEGEFVFDLYDDFAAANFQSAAVAGVIASADKALLSLEGGIGRTVGVWSELISQNIDTSIRKVDSVVRDGFRGGRTLQDMTQQIRGVYNRSAKEYRGGLLGINANRAETLVRTGVSHYANRARDGFMLANSDILDESVFFATLDNRTTTTCMGLHLKRYKNDDPAKPILPLHFNERSVYLFAGKGIDPTEGTRPVIGGRNGAGDEFESRQSRTDKKVKYKGRKDSDIFKVEEVSAKVTAQKWLERQPDWFIKSSLGDIRAKLFKYGGLSIDKFTDLQGRPLTIIGLKATAEGEKAFRRAGLD